MITYNDFDVDRCVVTRGHSVDLVFKLAVIENSANNIGLAVPLEHSDNVTDVTSGRCPIQFVSGHVFRPMVDIKQHLSHIYVSNAFETKVR